MIYIAVVEVWKECDSDKEAIHDFRAEFGDGKLLEIKRVDEKMNCETIW